MTNAAPVLVAEAAQLAQALGIVHHFVDGFYAKEARIPQYASVMQHKHAYDHDSVLLIGEVLVYEMAPGQQQETVSHHVAPAILKIKAGVQHKVLALRESLWFCVHKTDETDPSKVDEVLIQRE